MQFTAKLIQVLDPVSGISRSGNEWKRQDIIVETDGQYPRKVCVSVWGDKVSPSVLQIGALLDISCDLESREFNGKWYTSVVAWRIEPNGVAPDQAMPTEPFPSADTLTPAPSNDHDDLPF